MTEESVTRFATCPLCEATCGLALDIEGDTVVKVRGDAEDVFSAGFICPKGASIGELHADPDRISTPLVRRDGELVPASWDEAFAAIDEQLTPIRASGERNATAVYLGNPNAHTLDGLIYLRALIKAIGTRNIFSATSVDQLPKQISCAAMFGTGLSIPIPDVDHTDYMLILGANPLA
jgi:anaerobic selenocysteine-containing dehydrogenase